MMSILHRCSVLIKKLLEADEQFADTVTSSALALTTFNCSKIPSITLLLPANSSSGPSVWM
ncbi:MAG: hypothetical protein PF904_13770 [Kiritimatiellae bacterium]|nr:hypothetical protein [Kiritimatiellia bacterium]